MYSELPVENDSRLKLNLDELQRHYMPHLFLQALGLPGEVSLYLLEIGFRHSKQTMEAIYKVTWQVSSYSAELEVLLNQSPDRFINGVVLYRLATYRNFGVDTPEKERLIFEASRLIKEKDDALLSADELAVLGKVCWFNMRLTVPYFSVFTSFDDALCYFERASSLGCEESTLLLAKAFKNGLYGCVSNLTKAVDYELRGYRMGNLQMTADLAQTLEEMPSLVSELSFKELYKIGASRGDAFSKRKCLQYNLSY